MGEGFLVVPAIDILGGRCVRLWQGDYGAATVYNDEPVAVARRWLEAGAPRLHLVDLDGAREGRPVNVEVIRAVIEAVGVPCQVGGGIRTEEAVEGWLENGAAYVIVGSRAVREPQWLERVAGRFAHRVLLGLDVRAGRVAVSGWQETVSLSPLDFLRRVDPLPLAGIIYTAIERDGTLTGPAFDDLAQAVAASSRPVFASGGITTIDQVKRLARMPLAGCIIGKALYEGRLSLSAAIRAVLETKGSQA